MWPVRFNLGPLEGSWPKVGSHWPLTCVYIYGLPTRPPPSKAKLLCLLLAFRAHFWQIVYDDIWGSDGVLLSVWTASQCVHLTDWSQGQPKDTHTLHCHHCRTTRTHNSLTLMDYSTFQANNTDIRVHTMHKCPPTHTRVWQHIQTQMDTDLLPRCHLQLILARQRAIHPLATQIYP